MLQTRQFLAGLGPVCVGMLLIAGCDHSAPFAALPITPLGPLASGADVRLTTNPGADYWASWTEDGSGILYRYAQTGHSDDDRCIGLLPAAGGTRLWSLCDARGQDTDSSTSFIGAALGADGRLLYEELSAKKNKITPDHNSLWLASMTAPFTRREVLSFPTTVGASQVRGLNSIQWIAQDQFIALATDMQFPPSTLCGGPSCILVDTVLAGLSVVRGTVTASGATLTAIDGTAQAVDYSLAASGATIVFVRSALNVEQIPTTGGTPTIVTTFPLTGNRSITGLSCKGSTCVVLTLEGGTIPSWTLWSVALADGTQTMLRSGTIPLAMPRLSPLRGDVLLQAGARSAADLYLYKGILP